MNKITLSVLALTLLSATLVFASNFSSDRNTGDSTNKSSHFDKRNKSIFKATLPTPVTKEATNVTEEGYTANWEPVSGVKSYGVYSTKTHTAAVDGEYSVISDDFSKSKNGTISEPIELIEETKLAMYLDDYTNICDWYSGMPIVAKGMIGIDNQLAALSDKMRGVIYSPNLDLSHDNGKFYVELTVIGVDINSFEIQYFTGNDNTPIETYSEDITGEPQKFVFDFMEGSKISHLTILCNGGGMLFLDDIKIVQKLKTGEQLSINQSFVETVKTSCDFLTPDKTSEDGFSFVVTALAHDKKDNSMPSDSREVIYPSSINNARESGIRVYVDDLLNVALIEPTSIQVYSITGMCIDQIRGKEGMNHISLRENGIYLVKVGKEVFRVTK